MKKAIKRVLKALREWVAWFTTRGVLEAINNGATYDEVEQIVKKKGE